MNLHHLRSFLAVQKHLSYTRASRELLLSQPAVSRQIQQLEETLQVRLFEQIGKKLFLTDAGHTLSKEASKILGTVERAVEAVGAHRTKPSGSLRIGASTTPGLYLLPGSIRLFRERFPKAEVQLTVENSQTIERMLVKNELDLGFVGESMPDEAIETKPVAADEIICFAAPWHPLSKKRKINARELSGETWIIREKGSATRSLFESWLATSGTVPGKTIVFRSCEEAKLLVEAGVGISLMSTMGLKSEIARGRFRRLKIADLHLARSIYMAKHSDKLTTPAMTAFMKTLGTRA